MSKARKIIPGSVVRRLPRYLAHVQELRKKGREWVASHDLATALGLTSSTVRQDLTYLDFTGTSKRGYEARGLEASILRTLGCDAPNGVCVVGAGRMGRALALHRGFAEQGFIIRGIFDSDPDVVGQKVGALAVQGMEKLPSVVKSKGVAIGIITVPIESAQRVADRLVSAGVKGVLNFAPAHVSTPPGVPVVDARIVMSLQELSCRIRMKGGS